MKIHLKSFGVSEAEFWKMIYSFYKKNNKLFIKNKNDNLTKIFVYEKLVFFFNFLINFY